MRTIDQAGYAEPPAPIADILAATETPLLSVSPDGGALALLERDGLCDIAELSAPELRLAGLRIDPARSAPSRAETCTALSLSSGDGEWRSVALPADARIWTWHWSPDSARLALTLLTEAGVEPWLVEVTAARARRLGDALLNGCLGDPLRWLPAGDALLVRAVPRERGPAPVAPRVPDGPVIQEHRGGPAAAPTFQDLLRDRHDEELFAHHASARLLRLALDGGTTALGDAALICNHSPSPDGAYILLETLDRPFSYLVPWSRFPWTVRILHADGRPLHTLAALPLAEDVPVAFDAVRTGPRACQWRSDAPATLSWTEALDGGDPLRECAECDRVVVQEAPFTRPPRTLITLDCRHSATLWGSGDVALVHGRWWRTRSERRWLVAPDGGAAPRLLVERDYQDRYRDPGLPQMTERAGHPLLHLCGDSSDQDPSVLASSEGAGPDGKFPWLERWQLGSGARERLWTCSAPHLERPVAVLDAAGTRVITQREARSEAPHYRLHDLVAGTDTALTTGHDPAPQFADVRRELIRYTRADGVPLSGTLLTPAGYDADRDGPLPLLLWAYPREYRDPSVAGQVDDSPYAFERPRHRFWYLLLLTQGYAILDRPTMPIVGDEPNDSYVEQLVAGAQAAVDAVVARGVADPDRLAVAGHSYGAFMTANLLAHSRLFRAGVASSGAYNRTLTPFGFQQEQRSYWQVPAVYQRMSPFTHADRIDAPLLLVHGAADNNSGTFPLQSERFYQALKGNGTVARLVMLPHESHGYAARASVGHYLAEMVQWLDEHVKQAPSGASATSAVVAGG